MSTAGAPRDRDKASNSPVRHNSSYSGGSAAGVRPMVGHWGGRQNDGVMETPIDNGNGAGAGPRADRGRANKEPLFGDRRYIRQRLKALKAPPNGRSSAEMEAVQEALDGWRWL